MKNIIESLGLKPDATEADAVAAIRALRSNLGSSSEEINRLQAQLEKRNAGDSREAAINKKIAQSGGALSRDQAIASIENQERQDAATRKSEARPAKK